MLGSNRACQLAKLIPGKRPFFNVILKARENSTLNWGEGASADQMAHAFVVTCENNSVNSRRNRFHFPKGNKRTRKHQERT